MRGSPNNVGPPDQPVGTKSFTTCILSGVCNNRNSGDILIRYIKYLGYIKYYDRWHETGKAARTLHLGGDPPAERAANPGAALP